MNMSTVVAMQTQGRANLDRWVYTYRLEYSQDCVTFNRLLSVDGNNQVHVLQVLFKLHPDCDIAKMGKVLLFPMPLQKL